jgi:hypothetical protein
MAEDRDSTAGAFSFEVGFFDVGFFEAGFFEAGFFEAAFSEALAFGLEVFRGAFFSAPSFFGAFLVARGTFRSGV